MYIDQHVQGGQYRVTVAGHSCAFPYLWNSSEEVQLTPHFRTSITNAETALILYIKAATLQAAQKSVRLGKMFASLLSKAAVNDQLQPFCHGWELFAMWIWQQHLTCGQAIEREHLSKGSWTRVGKRMETIQLFGTPLKYKNQPLKKKLFYKNIIKWLLLS